ncbi:(d)CMP kinase [bacterium]|nr:(d)CMP kinase [bacterium]RQV95267.1 MAG: (d)CMP kinase [bacterium]
MFAKNEKKREGYVVTIDGPAGSGKSTTARLVARKLGWLYLDTGAMYRAVTVNVLRNQIPLDDPESIGRIAEQSTIELCPSKKGAQVLLNGDDVTDEIRHPQIDRTIGPVCEVPKVRDVMVRLQREIGRKGPVVAEGRDVGTVVFPDADVKFYMVASIEKRAQRRQNDLKRQGIDMDVDQLKEDIARRDKRDIQRKNSPLMKADDAILVDTTHLSIPEQVAFVIDHIAKKINL